MKIFVLIFILNIIVPSEGTILTINDNEYSLHKFYSRYPKKQWERADSLQKDKMYSDFIKRELCVLEAENLGIANDPSVAMKIRIRSRQALVNETYEQLVASPLMSKENLDAARKFAKREIFASHLLIGHSSSYLAKPPKRSLDEALLLAQKIHADLKSGEGFGGLAEKYSDDPGVNNNSGSLGWIQWGATRQEFQLAAFNLDAGEFSDPVLTDFGYHLIFVTDSRPSDFQYLSDDAYENFIFNITKNTIRDKLYYAALKYDSLKINNSNVVFNFDAIGAIVRAFENNQAGDAISGHNTKDASSLLQSLTNIGVVCVFDGKGFGSQWFAYRLGRVPSSRQPSFYSKDRVISAFKTVLLQEIAVSDGAIYGVDSSYSYLQKVDEMVSELLYDSYLKHLVNTATKPDSSDVKGYYHNNKEEKYLEPEKVVIHDLRVHDKFLADSLLMIAADGADFSLLASNFSSINPKDGGLYGPFARNNNKSLFDAASLLGIEEISPVLPVSNNQFSIIQLVENVPQKPIELSRVYARIESLLIKENQNNAKTGEIDGLHKKYNIEKSLSLLIQ